MAARQSHDLKVAGSNPASAILYFSPTKKWLRSPTAEASGLNPVQCRCKSCRSYQFQPLRSFNQTSELALPAKQSVPRKWHGVQVLGAPLFLIVIRSFNQTSVLALPGKQLVPTNVAWGASPRGSAFSQEVKSQKTEVSA